MKAFLVSLCVTGLVLAGVVFDAQAAPGRSGGSRSGGSRGSMSSSHQGSRGSMSSHRSDSHRPMRFENSRRFDKNYHLTHGRSFSRGYFYQGRNHYHWTHYTWWPRFGCYAYWCPSTSCYYYWAETSSCYYPVSYADSAPVDAQPTRSEELLNINVNNNNNNNNSNTVISGAVPTPVPVAPPARVAVRTTVDQELQAPGE